MRRTLNAIQLAHLLQRHRMLAARRSVMFGQKQTARVTLCLLWTFLLLYVMTMTGSLGLFIRHSFPSQALAVGCCLAPLFSLSDFLIRLSTQQSATHIIIPYLLLPIRKSDLVLPAVLSSLFTWSNALWPIALLPYIVIAALEPCGWPSSLSFLVYIWLLEMANSQWYAIVRTLAQRTWVWWLLPIALYAILLVPYFSLCGSHASSLMHIYQWPLPSIVSCNAVFYIGMSSFVAILLHTHRTLLNRLVAHELSWQEREGTYGTRTSLLNHIQQRCGRLGQYIWLEWLLVFRNKRPRRLFATALAITFGASLYICVADTGNDSGGMLTFWCAYCYNILGMFMLVRSLGYEGNYAGVLLMKKANIYMVLKAKYYFYSVYLLLPFLSLTPAMALGKLSVLSMSSLAIFTMGVQYFLIFQAIPYNKQRMSLNNKVVGKNGDENSHIILLIEIGVCSCPLLFHHALHWLAPSANSHVVMLMTGLAFVLLHHVWIGSVYHKFMANHYNIIQSFQE